MHENLSEDKHVESLLLPRLDAGSTPAGSTKKDASVVQEASFFRFRKFIVASTQQHDVPSFFLLVVVYIFVMQDVEIRIRWHHFPFISPIPT